MGRIFEEFNFSRESEQKRASAELTKKEKKQLVEESHSAALKRNERIDKESAEIKKTPGQIDRKFQKQENSEIKKYEGAKRKYDDARFKDFEYGGIHSPVNRPRKPSFDE